MGEYADSKTKLEKSAIVSKLVDLVRESSPEGAFVRYEAGSWWEVSDAVAREKVGAQLRDLLHTRYRSSSRAKLEKRKKATAESRQKNYESDGTPKVSKAGKDLSSMKNTLGNEASCPITLVKKMEH